MERDFIKILRKRKGNFFNDTLEYLFYEGFLDEHKDNHYKKLDCFIPNISVSLFEPIIMIGKRPKLISKMRFLIKFLKYLIDIILLCPKNNLLILKLQ